MGALLAPAPVMRFYDNNNFPLAGGQLYTYQAGTTTPAATYTDSTAITQNPNPVVMNARGEASVWLSPTQAYKFVLKDASGNTIWTADQITSPAPVAVGNMTDEKGSGGTFGFAANVDFTPNVTTTLTLSTNYGSASNLWVAFDDAEQAVDTFSLNGTTLTFNAPIANGINRVYVKGGTSLTIGTPSPGTVNDGSIAAGTKLSNRLNDFYDLRDPIYGAKCDGVTDDTAAVQRAINAIGASAATLIIPGPTLISGALTFGSQITLFPLNGGYLVGKAGTEVLTIQQTPLAGPALLLKNCAPISTVGMTVYVEWFGAVANNSTDCGPAFNAAFAFLKNVGGKILMQPGKYLTNETIVNNWSHIHLIGAGQNATMISMTSATLDGIQNFGVAGAPLGNCSFREFGLICSAAGSSTGSYGLNLQYNAFTLVENVQVQEFLYGVNLLRATNTQLVQVGSTYVAGATNGAICFNFNGGGTGTGGNASTTLRNCFASGNNNLNGSIGYKLTGVYMSDLFFENCETAGTNYGYYFDYTGASYFEDVIIQRPIVDQWTAQGIFIANMPVGGKLTVLGGWINPKAGANNSTTCVYVSACQGNIVVNGAQIVADADVNNTTGVNILNSTGVTLSANQITNTHVGVLMSGSGYNNIVGNAFKNDTSSASYYISGTGDARTMVNGNSFQGNATVGVNFDNTSSGSAVVGNTFRVTNIGTRVSNFATGAIGGSDGSTGLNTGY